MIIEVLNEVLSNILKKLNYETDAKVIKSNRPDLCDYQFDGVFKLAATYHKSPIEIGEEIVAEMNNLEDFNKYFKECSFVRPGFINIIISDELINTFIKKINNEENLGMKKVENPKNYFLDYGGPNIAKPLHVGHMRTAIVGESIKRIIKFMGHNVVADVHFGDYGLQIGQVIYGLKQEGIEVENITLEKLEEIYPKMSALCKEDESVKEICAKITKDLQDGSYNDYFKKICEISSNDIRRLYKYLDVDFDLWYGESDSYPYIPELEKMFNEKNLLEPSEGALIVDVNEGYDKEIPPLIFKKNNGAYLYSTTDLATIYQRMEDYNPDYILYVVDNRQSLHFEQVFRACKKSGLTDNTKLEFLGYGTVNGSDGKPYKTRSGNTPKLDGLFKEVKEIFISKKESNKDMLESDLDKIVNSILKFADLQNNREKDYIFDIAKFSEVVGKTGPYILYTYLRINKIVENENVTEIDNTIYNEFDRDLRKKLIEFDIEVKKAFESRLPSVIAEYIYDLCVIINAFYQNNHINGLEDQNKKNSWVYILKLSNKILKQMLDLLIIDVPTVM